LWHLAAFHVPEKVEVTKTREKPLGWREKPLREAGEVKVRTSVLTQRTASRATSPSDRQRIIELFAERQPTYTRAAVLRLVGISAETLSAAVASGAVTTEVNEAGDSVIPWEDVASLALEEWTPRMIDAAVHDEPDGVLPGLNRHHRIQVSLPIYLIRLLDHLARAASAESHVPRNASDIVERIVHEFANTQDTAALDTAIPGFAHALTYPYFIERWNGLLWYRCRYCGIAITKPARIVCYACEQRHEPDEPREIPELDEPRKEQP
jgi:hypothetical protein